MKTFLVITSFILTVAGVPHSPSTLGPAYTSVPAINTQFSSSTPTTAQQALRAAASIPQPIYSVPASLLQGGNSGSSQDYNSVLQEPSYSHSNPVLQSYGSPQQQQQQHQHHHQQQYQPQPQYQSAQQSRQLSQGYDNDQALGSQQQPLSYDQYSSLLENGNPPLHSTPFHVSNDYTETPAQNGNGGGGGGGDGKQTVVIHKHIHMHYFVRGAELPDLPPVPEEKTFVYVLLKKPDGPPSIVFPTQVPTKPSKPEVYFIQYKDNKNKKNEAQQQQQHSQSSSSSHSDHNDLSTLGSSNLGSSNPPVPSSQYGARIAKSTSSSA